MTFDGLSFSAFVATHAHPRVAMISVQTGSGWAGFDGNLDGLEIALTNGRVGRVDCDAPSCSRAAASGGSHPAGRHVEGSTSAAVRGQLGPVAPEKARVPEPTSLESSA